MALSDLNPLIGTGGGSSTRIGYEASPHELEWPSAGGDELPGPLDDRNCRLIVWDAKGRVLIRIED